MKTERKSEKIKGEGGRKRKWIIQHFYFSTQRHWYSTDLPHPAGDKAIINLLMTTQTTFASQEEKKTNAPSLGSVKGVKGEETRPTRVTLHPCQRSLRLTLGEAGSTGHTTPRGMRSRGGGELEIRRRMGKEQGERGEERRREGRRERRRWQERGDKQREREKNIRLRKEGI